MPEIRVTPVAVIQGSTYSGQRLNLFAQRDAAIGRVAEVGRRQWRKETGAHRQAAGENAMLRYKRIGWDRLRAKKPEAQAREAKTGVWVLNRMHELGMPTSKAVVAA